MYHRLLYIGYRASTALEHWMMRRFTKAGLFLLFALGASAGFGLDTNLTMAFQAFTFLLALLVFSMGFTLIAWFVTRFAFLRRLFKVRAELSARRILPRFGTVGVPLHYRVVLRNGLRSRQEGLSVLEDLADPRPPVRDFLKGRDMLTGVIGFLDRLVGYSRWNTLTARRRLVRVKEQTAPALPPACEMEVTMEMQPLRRGHARFDSLTVARTDVFGICKSFTRQPEQQSLVILPRRYTVPTLDLAGTRQYQQGGVALASSVGESDEFVAIRDFRAGDPLRRIHWKSSARAGRPVVKEYQDEFFVRHALVLDTFAANADEAVFEEAVSVAASFACTVPTQDSLLDLMFVGDRAYCFTAGRGVAHVDQMLEILASVQVCPDKAFESLKGLVQNHAAAMSGCLCVLTAWDEERKRFVEFLRSLQVPMHVFVVTGGAAADLDPGPMRGDPGSFHHLRIGRVEEALAKL